VPGALDGRSVARPAALPHVQRSLQSIPARRPQRSDPQQHARVPRRATSTRRVHRDDEERLGSEENPLAENLRAARPPSRHSPPQLCATAAKLHLSRRAWNLVDSFAPASLRGWRHHYLEPQSVHQHSEASLPPPHSEHIVSQCRQRHVGVQSLARQRPGPRHRTESAGRIAAWSIRWHRLQEMQLHGRVKHRRVKSPQHGFAFGQPFWVPLGTPVEGSATEEQWPYKQTREEAGRPSNPRLLA
jgi:hypothetical protein